MIRLNRYIASSTKYSRRQADSFIRRRQVSINDKIISDLGTQVFPGDIVKLDGKIITPLKKVYYLLNKPVGYVSTVKDQHADKIIMDLIPKNPPVFPVGRLDKNSRGLIIMTNDGELAQRLTHPGFDKEKEYIVITDKKINKKDMHKLMVGWKMEAGFAKFEKIKNISGNKYKIILKQGLNRQIRKMLEALGIKVVDLLRVRIAGIKLLDLPEGSYRQLSKSDIMKLIDK